MTTENLTDSFANDAFICLGQHGGGAADPVTAAEAGRVLRSSIRPRAESMLHIEHLG